MKNQAPPSRPGMGSLYWKISGIFLLILIVLAGTYIWISVGAAEMYFSETSQKLNRGLAESIATHTRIFEGDHLNEEAVKETFQDVMVVNPSAEVYLLDKEGRILSFYAPKSKVKVETVPLGPIKSFIKDEEEGYVTNEDPRHPDQNKVFSAAEVRTDGQLAGYIYVVLASEELAGVTQRLMGSYYLRLAGRSMLITLFAALIIGLLLIWLLTRNLRQVITAVRRFRKGDLEARAELRGQGEFSRLAADFNDMADTIVRNIDELKSVEELRRELIANVSHDLRTPLAAVQGYAETLMIKEGELDAEARRRYTEVILRSTQRIKKLVDDLFELSKLESRQVRVNPEFFSLPELVHDTVQKYELPAGEKQIRIRTETPEDIPLTYGDIALIDRVLQNLLDNALAHTPEGGEISVGLRKDKTEVRVWVQDTGMGIPADELPYIFDRYRKGQPQKEGGTGLGLAIVQKILELHRSVVEVESRQNEGTIFQFPLPTTSFSPV